MMRRWRGFRRMPMKTKSGRLRAFVRVAHRNRVVGRTSNRVATIAVARVPVATALTIALSGASISRRRAARWSAQADGRIHPGASRVAMASRATTSRSLATAPVRIADGEIKAEWSECQRYRSRVDSRAPVIARARAPIHRRRPRGDVLNANAARHGGPVVAAGDLMKHLSKQ